MPTPVQDSVRGGKPGNRQQCVAAARRGLAAGSNIIVDRTNFDAAQRADFIALARSVGSQVPSRRLSAAITTGMMPQARAAELQTIVHGSSHAKQEAAADGEAIHARCRRTRWC